MNNCEDETEYNDTATAVQPLIGHLWARAREQRIALLEAKSGDDSDRIEAMELQFRATALLLASEPAATMDDLTPKVLVVAMLRCDAEMRTQGPSSHLWRMVEIAITADMRELQPPFEAPADA